MSETSPNDDARLDGGAADGLDERAKPVQGDNNLVDTEVNAEGETRVDLYNANHGKSPRTGGPYLDDIQAEDAERRRAKIEDREPDLDNPPADVGTVLVPKSALVERDTDKSHFSDRVEVVNEPVDSYVVPAEENKPDPTQPDWDNDSTKVAALEASQRYDELKEKAEAKQVSETPVADPNPSDSEGNASPVAEESASGTPEPDPNNTKETWEA